MTLSEKIQEQVEAAWKEGLSRAHEVADRPAVEPSDEPLQWKRDGRLDGVIRPDRAVIALRYIERYVIMRVVPFVMEIRLAQMQKAIEKWAAEKVAGSILRRILGKLSGVINVAFEITEIMEEQRIEAEIERLILEKTLEVQRDLLEWKMKREGGRKKTELVYSRNRTPKQRRASE